MGWKSEFGEEYDVPTEISEALPDTSWHNDACPSFGETIVGVTDNHDLKIWVEHPDVDLRDSGSEYRFLVMYNPWSDVPVPGLEDSWEVYEGDDVNKALRVYNETLTKIKEWYESLSGVRVFWDSARGISS